MRKKTFGIGLLVLALFGLVIGGAAAYRGTPGPNPEAPQTYADEYSAPLSDDEASGLLYMVEEEKLARDVYLALYNETGLTVFERIARSEQMHMDAVLSLIEKYNLTAPETLNEQGVFQNEELQALYDRLVEMGSQNTTEALRVGALIEETDIKDLQNWLAKTDNEDIERVYEHLMAGSENHLRAFTRNLEAYGVDYRPQVLDGEQYKEIISSTGGHGHGMMAGKDMDDMRGSGRNGMGRMNGEHRGMRGMGQKAHRGDGMRGEACGMGFED